MSLSGKTRQPTKQDINTPSRGDVFEVLSNERRRYVLRAMRKREDETLNLSTLAEQVAAWEQDVSPPEVSYHERKNVYTALQQTHLPKMDEAGAINYDKHRGDIEWDQYTDEFDYYLTIVPSGTLVYSHYYLSLGAGSFVFSILLALGFLQVPFVSELVLAGILIGVFTSLSVIHLLHRTQSKQGTKNRGVLP